MKHACAHNKVRAGLLAATRQPEGEDEHGFDPAVIFKRYLWDRDPAEERTERAEAPPPTTGLEGREKPPVCVGAGARPEVLEGIGQAGARGVGVGVASTVLASGWPAVQPGRNAADRKLPRAAAVTAR